MYIDNNPAPNRGGMTSAAQRRSERRASLLAMDEVPARNDSRRNALAGVKAKRESGIKAEVRSAASETPFRFRFALLQMTGMDKSLLKRTKYSMSKVRKINLHENYT